MPEVEEVGDAVAGLVAFAAGRAQEAGRPVALLPRPPGLARCAKPVGVTSMRNLRHFLGAIGVLLVLGGTELTARPETFVAGQRVRMKVDVPVGYSFETETNEHGITLVQMENPVWRITLRVYISPEYSADMATEEGQRSIVASQSSFLIAESKEQDYKWQPLNSRRGSGVYCVFTDPAAKKVSELGPDSYMHIVTGAKVIKGASMYFQIYCNDLKSPEYAEILDRLINGFDAG